MQPIWTKWIVNIAAKRTEYVGHVFLSLCGAFLPILHQQLRFRDASKKCSSLRTLCLLSFRWSLLSQSAREAKSFWQPCSEHFSPANDRAAKFEKGQHLNDFFAEQKVCMFSCSVINVSQHSKYARQLNSGWAVCTCVSCLQMCLLSPPETMAMSIFYDPLPACAQGAAVSMLCTLFKRVCQCVHLTKPLCFLAQWHGWWQGHGSSSSSRSHGRAAGKQQQQQRKGSRCAQYWSLLVQGPICPSICIAVFPPNWIAWLSSFFLDAAPSLAPAPVHTTRR